MRMTNAALSTEPAMIGSSKGDHRKRSMISKEAANPPMAVTSLKKVCNCFWIVLFMGSLMSIYLYIFFPFRRVMVSERVLFIINVSLGLLSALLLLTLLGVKLPTLGQAQYALDKEELVCMLEWKEELTKFNDIDRCCLQARQQFECKAESRDNLDWVCGAGEGLQVWLNNKA